ARDPAGDRRAARRIPRDAALLIPSARLLRTPHGTPRSPPGVASMSRATQFGQGNATRSLAAEMRQGFGRVLGFGYSSCALSTGGTGGSTMPRPIAAALRRALRRRWQQGQDATTIAAELGLAARTVRRFLSRLRQRP